MRVTPYLLAVAAAAQLSGCAAASTSRQPATTVACTSSTAPTDPCVVKAQSCPAGLAVCWESGESACLSEPDEP